MVNLTDKTRFTGKETVYAYSNSGKFPPTAIQPSNVKVTQNSEDVVNCESNVTILYTVAPRTSYVCVATTSLEKFNQWRSR